MSSPKTGTGETGTGQGLAVYALTRQGAETASRLVRALPEAELFLSARLGAEFPQARTFTRLASALADNFQEYQGHILFCAAGIVVRGLAPLLQDKTRDPAVVVLDQEGRFAVSLLSGHLGGANDLARQLAGILDGQVVITTATDTAGLPSLEQEAADLGYGVENIRALAKISSALLDGKPVKVYDPEGWMRPVADRWPSLLVPVEEADPKIKRLVWVGWQALTPLPGWLVIRPPCLGLGVGCNRGTPAREIRDLWWDVVSLEGLSPACVMALASVEAKRDEAGILEFGRSLNAPLRFFSKEDLNRIKVPHPSATVKRHMGVESVCEAAAILATDKGRLVVPKRKTRNATLAVALASSTWSD